MGIAVTGVRERDLFSSAAEKLDFAAARIKRKMEELRRSAEVRGQPIRKMPRWLVSSR